MSLWARVAIVAGLLGLIVANTFLPSWLQGPLLAVFVLVGPGAAVCAWVPVERAVALVIVPTTGPVAVVLYGTFAVHAGGLEPLLSLAVGSAITVAAGLGRSVADARSAPASTEVDL